MNDAKQDAGRRPVRRSTAFADAARRLLFSALLGTQACSSSDGGTGVNFGGDASPLAPPQSSPLDAGGTFPGTFDSGTTVPLPPSDSGSPHAADAGLMDAAQPGGYVDPDSGLYVYPLAPNTQCRDFSADIARHHPAGYDLPEVHGVEATLAKSDCKSCHGDNLEGCGRSPSCNSCHSGGHDPGWQTDCVYCHGGRDEDSGAPPYYLDERDLERPGKTFLVHAEHVTEGDHPAYDCVQCHVKPDNTLSKGHMFDLPSETPGKAEVVFSAGLSKAGSFSQGQCSSVYCHGNGRTNGSVSHTETTMTCTSCHADRTQPTQLGGAHALHLNTTEGGQILCADCHGDVVAQGDAVITGPKRHVNGVKDVRMPSEINMTVAAARTCTGTCHGFNHDPPVFFVNRTW